NVYCALAARDSGPNLIYSQGAFLSPFLPLQRGRGLQSWHCQVCLLLVPLLSLGAGSRGLNAQAPLLCRSSLPWALIIPCGPPTAWQRAVQLHLQPTGEYRLSVLNGQANRSGAPRYPHLFRWRCAAALQARGPGQCSFLAGYYDWRESFVLAIRFPPFGWC